MPDAKPLYELLQLQLGNRNIEKTELPRCITDNLNRAFAMRPYQKTAFQLFVNYWKEDFVGKPRRNHQLLFHMATGSGKTLMMAGLILYLYEQGFRNFLFFVNSTNIINKTRDNFLNSRSGKYLFAESVTFGDQRVMVREVENFQAASKEDINIVFSTIQGLHMSLNTPRENGLTYEDFEDQKIVLISDEAHHINAETRRGALPIQDESLETMSWEGTVERLFKAHENNLLLEFTATVDFTDENLAKKYQPKLIFDYPLKDFRVDGYSKEVKVLQADLPPFERALQAVLLSQYRRKLFEKTQKPIKPVILFKSKTIKESQAFLEEFRDGIKGLQASTLDAIRVKTDDTTMLKMFAHLEAHSVTLENLAIEIKEDFSEDKLISVNSKEESDTKQLAVNSLEDEGNEYRAVFAVDKLNEGWDVLNLFDIVRLYNTRDGKAGKVGRTTMSEAQLIGRGARYCRFQVSDHQPLYARKFDADLENELRVCEELYYHSAYNPKYIQELNTALQEIGIQVKKTLVRKIKLKDSFMETPLYKAGYIYLNSRQKNERDEVNGLDNSLIGRRYKVMLSTGYIRSSVAFDASTNGDVAERRSKDYDLCDFGIPVLRKATQRLRFYEFSNLKQYLPHLASMAEFITSDRYLGKIKLEVSGSAEQVEDLAQEEKLDAAVQILDTIAGLISSGNVEFKGTKRFKPYMLKNTFTDKTLTFALDDSGEKEFGRSMNNASETSYPLDLSTRHWYAFNDCYGTSEEKLLVLFIEKKYEDLKKKYSEVCLIRNEKHFQLYNFDDGRPLEPDFVLYLIGKDPLVTMHYQVFIEPKGAHLLKADEWKEKFLVSIKTQFEIEELIANKNYAVWGLPFYNSGEELPKFEEAFGDLL
jgi:type III restriction enzyme